MKAIQTLWGAATGGHTQPPLMWQLSLHFLRRTFGRVELYADAQGRAFAKGAGLVYDTVHELPPPRTGLERVWSVGKLLAAAQQSEPFLHVDGDAFVRKAPEAAAFIVQNEEHWHHGGDFYQWWDAVPFRPVQGAPIVSYCFGIFGGMAATEIATACRQAVDFMEAHAAKMIALLDTHPCAPLLATCLVEQIWVPMLLKEAGITPTPYLRSGRLWDDAVSKKFFHAMDGKRSALVQDQVQALAQHTL
ncbi:MAG: hypothetical protein IAE97_01580 [Chthoniobacterales bacterium]|nr:hypothetical protein [Chthoniobacterales bacterium]